MRERGTLERGDPNHEAVVANWAAHALRNCQPSPVVHDNTGAPRAATPVVVGKVGARTVTPAAEGYPVPAARMTSEF